MARTQDAGDRTEEQSYAATDDRPRGDAYYRLRTINLDGTEHLSGVIFVDRVEEGTSYSVYPNPAGAEAQLRVYRPEATTLTLRLTDASGREVWTAHRAVSAGESALPLQVSTLRTGLYFLVVSDELGKREVIKVTRR